MTLPASSYRLQLRGGVTLRDAERLVPYLHDLGATHVYCSPILRARSGSEHGYDGVDPTALDPALGGEEDLEAFVAALRRHGMGAILDLVPNHLAASHENPWWSDVLAYGRASPYADFFDIDWEPERAELRGKVLLPVLGAPYREVLERGELRPGFDAASGRFHVAYGEQRFPLAPTTWARLLPDPPPELRRIVGDLASLGARGGDEGIRERAEALVGELAAAVAGDAPAAAALASRLDALAGEPGSFEALHAVLESQHYRLAHWRAAADALNYRRFFDVTELVGLRVERDAVFEACHRLVLRWIDASLVDGLRIDHVDGLRDPRAYCRRLRARLPEGSYLVVEKILAPHESLPADWPVDGTTGYEFLDLVNGLFVDPAGEAALDRIHAETAGGDADFDALLHAAKLHVIDALLGAETRSLACKLERLAETEPARANVDRAALREALREIAAGFRVYRTYVTADGASPADRAEIAHAVASARARRPDLDARVLDWIADLLGAPRGDAGLDFAARVQQYTGPVTAKSLEDTAFYRYPRLLSLNEVGGDPRRFGVSVEDFHAANRQRTRRWPRAMLATATHDTKRGEDARLRIDVLSEMPAEWGAAVRRWMDWNAAHKRPVHGRPAPTARDEYMLYQTLVGAWPAEPDGAPPDDLRARIEAWGLKAVREGKQTSSWLDPDVGYEGALADFVAKLLDPARSPRFLDDFARFHERVARLGALNGLAQLVLKLAAPGVPDVYQGCELWDLSLVDPDNRRPVDFERRRRWLAEIHRESSEPQAARACVRRLATAWRDGRIKLLLTSQLLRFRRDHSALLRDGDYLPLEVRGPAARHVCAFARRSGDEALVVAVARLAARLPTDGGPFPVGAAAWKDTRVTCPAGCGEAAWRDVLVGGELRPREAGASLGFEAAALFADLPVAAVARVS